MPVRWTPTAESRFHLQLTGVGQALRWLPASGDGKDQLADLPSLATTARPEASQGAGRRAGHGHCRRLGRVQPR